MNAKPFDYRIVLQSPIRTMVSTTYTAVQILRQRVNQASRHTLASTNVQTSAMWPLHVWHLLTLPLTRRARASGMSPKCAVNHEIVNVTEENVQLFERNTRIDGERISFDSIRCSGHSWSATIVDVGPFANIVHLDCCAKIKF
jgi:hypothetical protein